MMTMMVKTFVMLVPLLAVSADNYYENHKDTNWYPWGPNPNVEDPLYWREAINVLQDIEMFEALYIRFHGCVWSATGNGAQELDNGCGGYEGDGYDGAFWYMGRTQCFRANAAYTLYGVLKEYDNSGGGDNKCTAKTYINSYFTFYGVDYFTDALGIAVDGIEGYDNLGSYCNAEEGHGDDKDDHHDEADDDRMYGYYHLDWLYSSYTSTTMGCSDGKFVFDEFYGGTCNGLKYYQTISDLPYLNEAMEEVQCVQIWDYDEFLGNNKRRNLPSVTDRNAKEEHDKSSHRRLEDDYEKQWNEYGSVAEDILGYSRVCSIRQFPGSCPDPFGIKAKYAKSIKRTSNSLGSGVIAWAKPKSLTNQILTFSSYGLLAVGIVMGILSFFKKDDSRPVSKSKRDRGQRRGMFNRQRTAQDNDVTKDSQANRVRERKSGRKDKADAETIAEESVEREASFMRATPSSVGDEVKRKVSEISGKIAAVASSATAAIRSYADDDDEDDDAAPHEKTSIPERQTTSSPTPSASPMEDLAASKAEGAVENQVAANAILSEQGAVRKTTPNASAASSPKKKKRSFLTKMFGKTSNSSGEI